MNKLSQLGQLIVSDLTEYCKSFLMYWVGKILVLLQLLQLQPKIFNYNYNYNYSSSGQLQFQLQLQRKNSQNVATNSVTDEASSFAYVNLWICLNCFVFLYQTYQSPIFFYFVLPFLFNFNFCNT